MFFREQHMLYITRSEWFEIVLIMECLGGVYVAS